MVKLLDEHYLNHPIARLNNKYDAAANLASLTDDTDIIINVDEIDFDTPRSDLTASAEQAVEGCD